MSAFLLPSRNSTARYWWLWNPELVARNGRIRAYSLGVSVASTSHCSTSCFCTCLTRASRFSAGDEVVGGQQRPRRVQLVQQQLHPQLGDLVLHDEEQLVVLHRLAARVLRRQQGVEVEVGAVRHRLREVGGDPLLQHALGPVDGVASSLMGALCPVSSGPSATDRTTTDVSAEVRPRRPPRRSGPVDDPGCRPLTARTRPHRPLARPPSRGHAAGHGRRPARRPRRGRGRASTARPARHPRCAPAPARRRHPRPRA